MYRTLMEPPDGYLAVNSEVGLDTHAEVEDTKESPAEVVLAST
jgi:hypothetical protein